MAMTPGMVGEAFARQYYVVLEQFPEYVYRFYTEASRLTRAETGANGLPDTARSPREICSLVMSSAASGCRAQIKTLDAQESFAGSVVVLVTGSMHKKDTSRSFVQSFFLAPQERGFYVLNDIFRYLDDEPQPINPGSGHYIGDGSDGFNTRDRLHTGPSEAVKKHFGMASRVESGTGEAFDTSDNGGFPIVKEVAMEGTASHLTEEALSSERLGQKDQRIAIDGLRPAGAEDISAERLSYANILRYAKDSATRVQVTNQVQQAPAKVHSSFQPSYFPQLSSVQGVPHTAEEPVVADNEDEVKSVYMNLHSSITEAQLHEALKKFGAVKRGGIIIRARKDGGSYAFVEFEDPTSALSVIKASPVSIGGQSTWVEPKKSTFEGGRGVRGRGQGRGTLTHGPHTALGGGRGSKPDTSVYGGSRLRV